MPKVAAVGSIPERRAAAASAHTIADPFERLARLFEECAREMRQLRRLPQSLVGTGNPGPADEIIPIAVAAGLLGVSKDAARKQAQRRGVALEVGGRYYVPRGAVPRLYPRGQPGEPKRCPD